MKNNIHNKGRRKNIVEPLIILAFVVLFLSMTFIDPQITGQVIFGQTQTDTHEINLQQNFTKNSSIPFEENNTLSFKISGEIKGNATIWINTTDGLILVYETKESQVSRGLTDITGLATGSSRSTQISEKTEDNVSVDNVSVDNVSDVEDVNVSVDNVSDVNVSDVDVDNVSVDNVSDVDVDNVSVDNVSDVNVSDVDEKTFRVGSPEVVVDDISASSFTLGGIAGFDILLRNLLGEEIRGVYADVEFRRDSELIEEFTTQTVNIAGGDRSQVQAYFDTQGMSAGLYDLIIKLYYLDQVTKKSQQIRLESNNIDIIGTGRVIEETETSDGMILLIVVIFFLVVMNGFLLYKFVFKKKK